MSVVFAFQDAVIARLRADAPLQALLNGSKIYDQPPGDSDRPKSPWVYVGAVNLARVEGCGRHWFVRMRLFAVSDDLGRKQAWQIVEAIGDSLEPDENGWMPTLAAPYAAEDVIRVVQSGDVIEPMNPNEAFCDLTCSVYKET